MRTLILAAAGILLLAACGTRGPLTLPPKPQAQTAADVSSKPALEVAR